MPVITRAGQRLNEGLWWAGDWRCLWRHRGSFVRSRSLNTAPSWSRCQLLVIYFTYFSWVSFDVSNSRPHFREEQSVGVARRWPNYRWASGWLTNRWIRCEAVAGGMLLGGWCQVAQLEILRLLLLVLPPRSPATAQHLRLPFVSSKKLRGKGAGAGEDGGEESTRRSHQIGLSVYPSAPHTMYVRMFVVGSVSSVLSNGFNFICGIFSFCFRITIGVMLVSLIDEFITWSLPNMAGSLFTRRRHPHHQQQVVWSVESFSFLLP